MFNLNFWTGTFIAGRQCLDELDSNVPVMVLDARVVKVEIL